jgi:hypothetical protein
MTDQELLSVALPRRWTDLGTLGQADPHDVEWGLLEAWGPLSWTRRPSPASRNSTDSHRVTRVDVESADRAFMPDLYVGSRRRLTPTEGQRDTEIGDRHTEERPEP